MATVTGNPLDPKTIDRNVANIADSLEERLRGVERAAIAALLTSLSNIDWETVSEEFIEKATNKAVNRYVKAYARAKKLMLSVLDAWGDVLAASVRKANKKKHKLKIPSIPPRKDSPILSGLSTLQTLFVDSAANKRAVAYIRSAKQAARASVREGLHRKKIDAAIKSTVVQTSAERIVKQWRTVASTYESKVRTYITLTSFRDAGVIAYRHQSIIDNRTSEICRFMDGRVFYVADAISQFEKMVAADTIDEAKGAHPWVYSAKNDKGQQALFFKDGEKRKLVARVMSPGAGTNRVGRYTNAMSTKALLASGISVPPLHAYCRSILVPVLG